MAAPLSGRKFVSFLLLFGGSLLGFVLWRHLQGLPIIPPDWHILKKSKKDEEEEAAKKHHSVSVSDLCLKQSDSDEKGVQSEILKASNLAFSLPQPEGTEINPNISDEQNVAGGSLTATSAVLGIGIPSPQPCNEDVANANFDVENDVDVVENDVDDDVPVDDNVLATEDGMKGDLDADKNAADTGGPAPVFSHGDQQINLDELPPFTETLVPNSSNVSLYGSERAADERDADVHVECGPVIKVLDESGIETVVDESGIEVLDPDDDSLDASNGEDFSLISPSMVEGASDTTENGTPKSSASTSSPSGPEADIRETFAILSQYGGAALTDKHARVLVQLMTSQAPDDDVIKVLKVVQNCAAFTTSQNLLRQAGCLEALHRALVTMTSSVGDVTNREKLNAINGAIANLAVNKENQKTLKESIPTLISLLEKLKPNDASRLSTLQALTNLSASPDNHSSYTRIIQELYGLLGCDDVIIVLQTARILVNLSTNADMVPYLLAAKAPEVGVSQLLMTDSYHEDIVLRWVTFLANVTQCVNDLNLKAETLPSYDKAASPETMYVALFGHDNMQVKVKVFILLEHEHEDIQLAAKRAYSALQDK